MNWSLIATGKRAVDLVRIDCFVYGYQLSRIFSNGAGGVFGLVSIVSVSVWTGLKGRRGYVLHQVNEELRLLTIRLFCAIPTPTWTYSHVEKHIDMMPL